jgi:tetratricopeptide (TPR) repeat protein
VIPGGLAVRVAALGAAALLVGAAARPRTAGLEGVDRLASIYDQILDTRFDQARQALASGCGGAPAEACQVLQTTLTWWRILLNPNDTSLDQTFQSEADATVEACDRWTEREPARAEAWFYLGGAYGLRVSWKVQRGQRLSAARDGKHIKESLERALELDPRLEDARFGIGLYKYYADLAPTFAKILRFLLLLPGGDRVEGLRDMEAVHAKGRLLRGEADYQLHWIYLWYENQPGRALDLLTSLRRRYPDNPHFAQRLAEIEREYFHDPAASLAVWQSMVEGASRMGDPQLAEVAGRLGAAEELDRLDETDRALDSARKALALRPERPYGAGARAHLLEGGMLDRLGERSEAMAAYNAALAAAPRGDPDGVADKARAGLRTAPDPARAAAYRTSLSGWRAYERGALDEGSALLARAASDAPGDAMIEVRLGRVRQARHETDAALAAFDRVIARRSSASPIALSAAWAWSAELLEARGDTDAARTRYRAATHVFGGDSRRAREAARALERLDAK